MPDLVNSTEAWSAVAAAWDIHVGEIDHHSAAATDALVSHLDVRPGETVLELAAGPGSLAATWSRLVGPAGRVIVTDVAPGMVEVARQRTGDLDNVETAVMDLTAIELPDASCDVVACRMGLMFVPEPSLGMDQIRRVLRPGGRVGVLTWGAIERNPWMTCVGMAAMMTGIQVGGPPTEPGGLFSLSSPESLEGLALAAEFGDVRLDSVPVVFRAGTVDEHIERVTSLAGPLAVALRNASPDQQQAFRRTASDLAAAHLTPRGLEIAGLIVMLTARR